MRRWVIPFLLLFVLTSCRMPSMIPAAGGPGIAAPQRAGMVLKGRIEGDRTVAAIDDWRFDEIVSGATIALIDSETGLTLGSSLANPDKTFVMAFGEDFVPVDGRAYYLDLLKGVRLEPGNPASPYNQAGGDVLRLRNILFYQEASMASAAGWKSLYSATTSSQVVITNRTTTLSVAIALKRQAGETLNLDDYIGALENDPFVPVGGVTTESFDALKLIVEEALNNDRDPIQYVVYDDSQGSFLNPWIGFSISDVTPKEGGIGTEITIVGDGFDLGPPLVSVNGVQAEVLSVTADTIRARVNPGSRTGPVSVKIGTTTQAAQTFKVIFHDGHSALIGDKLYVANPSWHTVVEVSPNGDVKKLWDKDTLADLNTPTQIAVWDNKLYVSCKGNGKILKLDPANPDPAAAVVFNPTSLVTSAYGLAFDIDGNLYVSSNRSAPNGEVVKLNTLGVRVAGFPGFDLPRGLAFDYLGNLFVAEEGGRIAKLTAPAMTTETWGVVPSPMGLAVDSAGDLFVTSNTNNVVYRITRFRAMSVFAMLNSPGGITRDERGYFYVSDTAKNLVNRIAPTGDAKIYAYGISNPRGLAVDPVSGTIYVSLSQSNAILKVEGGVLKPFVTGIANPMTVKFRGNGLLIAHPETHTISYAQRNGNLSTLATGLEYPGGADQAVDGGGNLTGPLYAARYGDLDSGATARPPRYSIYALTYGGSHGVDLIEDGSKTLRRWLYRHNVPTTETSYIALDADNNIFLLDTNAYTLTKISAAPGGGNTSRVVQRLCGERSPYAFQNKPGWVSVDAVGNVYVSVPAEDVIYRFLKASSYAMDKITGFDGPWGIAFSDTSPQAMFVSNTADGLIRRVTTPATAMAADSLASFSIPGNTSIFGLAYMATATPGTGTLYMANGSSVKKAELVANAYSAGTYGDYRTGLSSWKYLYANSGTKELFGYGNRTFVYKLSAPPDLVLSEHINWTGDGTMDTFAMSPSFANYTISTRHGMTSMAPLITTREVELHGDYLYVASPDTYDGRGVTNGGLLRINLNTQEELFLPLRSYSLGVESTSGHLYLGASDSKIYRMDAAGKHDPIWSLGAVPYGLDVRGTTVWAVGSNGLIFEQIINDPTIRSHKYGMEKPGF
jgi:hypothetical protein